MSKISIEKILRKASSHEKKEEIFEAQISYQSVLQSFPENPRARKALEKLNKGRSKYIVQRAPNQKVTELIEICKKGKFIEVIKRSREILLKNPKDFMIWNILGVAHKSLGQYVEALNSFKTAIKFNPEFAAAHNNIGLTLQNQSRSEDAVLVFNLVVLLDPKNPETYNNRGIALMAVGKQEMALEDYKKAISLKPNYAEAWYNMANVHMAQRDIVVAIEAYYKAILFKPDFAEAYLRIGQGHIDLGNLDSAIEAYKKASVCNPKYAAQAHNNLGGVLKEKLDIYAAINAFEQAILLNPDLPKPIENYFFLGNQLSFRTLSTRLNVDFDKSGTSAGTLNTPSIQIQLAIRAFLNADLEKTRQHIEIFSTLEGDQILALTEKDRKFCIAYFKFLSKLLRDFRDKPQNSDKKIYHLGESHCLSYAHRLVQINNQNFQIIPRVVFGAKAFHFSKREKNLFKKISKLNFDSLPNKSIIFLSFGEIDCRPDEGFITAGAKKGVSVKDLIVIDARRYVDWFAKQNKTKCHNMYFFNVPAPVFNKALDQELNKKVAETVKLFNNELSKNVNKHGLKIIDVYGSSKGSDGFSNGSFHIDNHHLGADMLQTIQSQLK
ncbi:MAG: tetratricopeptide repeat protein [Paracoccaceae bacterium]